MRHAGVMVAACLVTIAVACLARACHADDFTIVHNPPEDLLEHFTVKRSTPAEAKACRELGACLARREGFPLGRVDAPGRGLLCRVLFSGGPIDLELSDPVAAAARCQKQMRLREGKR